MFFSFIYASATIRTMLEAVCFVAVHASICASMRVSVMYESLFAVSYKPLVGISPNVQFWCSWDRNELIKF